MLGTPSAPKERGPVKAPFISIWGKQPLTRLLHLRILTAPIAADLPDTVEIRSEKDIL
jgi:hypothetical protein